MGSKAADLFRLQLTLQLHTLQVYEHLQVIGSIIFHLNSWFSKQCKADAGLLFRNAKLGSSFTQCHRLLLLLGLPSTNFTLTHPSMRQPGLLRLLSHIHTPRISKRPGSKPAIADWARTHWISLDSLPRRSNKSSSPLKSRSLHLQEAFVTLHIS